MAKLRSSALLLSILAVAVARTACGDSGSEPPSSAASRDAAAQLKYCIEGAGGLTASPGKRVAELDGVPDAPELKDARHILVLYWADTKDVANAYYARSDEAGAKAAEDLGVDGVEFKNQVVVVPDEDSPPSTDEALLISDCLL
jgi:hypothetical protein